MQKILFAFTFLFSLSSIAIAQEKSSFEEKVARMLEVSGARQNFDAAILNMVELQKRAYADILSDEFFDELGKEMMKVGFEKLTPEFVPIYKRHLTEEELDEIIKFYESEVGQSLVQKMPLIMNEAMQIGAAWGEEIGQEIYERVEAANSGDDIPQETTENCSAFKEGEFYSILDDDSKVTFKINGDQLTIKDKRKKETHTIEWISDCSYKIVKENGETPEIPKEIRITEVNEKSCKIIIIFDDSGEYEEREFFIK